MTGTAILQLAKSIRLQNALFGTVTTHWRVDGAEDALVLLVRAQVIDACDPTRDAMIEVNGASRCHMDNLIGRDEKQVRDRLLDFFMTAVRALLVHELQEQVRVGELRPYQPHEHEAEVPA